MSEFKKEINVEMISEDVTEATRTYNQHIIGFVRFGKEIKVTPKANATINKPGFMAKFHGETVSVLIGIGKSHTADLIMDKEAWEALNAGEEISIDTTEQFKKKCGL